MAASPWTREDVPCWELVRGTPGTGLLPQPHRQLLPGTLSRREGTDTGPGRHTVSREVGVGGGSGR